jgi:hypothetical protein
VKYFLTTNYINEEALRVRANSLKDEGKISHFNLNGIDFVEVSLTSSENVATLKIHFFNYLKLQSIIDDYNSIEDAEQEEYINKIFSISGGFRVKNVKVVKQPITKCKNDINSLKINLKPIGDYSTYTLEIKVDNFDPLFDNVNFKFRPGCFETVCKPHIFEKPFLSEEPIINYLAKDYDTFKHTMITAMSERVPGWQPTSEADLDQVLIDQISATADQLSDFQDRVMNEAYFETARKRVSIARYARLFDYHIYQGNQADTFLVVIIKNGKRIKLPPEFLISTKSENSDSTAIIYATKDFQYIDYLLNELNLYTWSGTKTILKEGSTEADLTLSLYLRTYENYAKVKKLIEDKIITHFVIQETKIKSKNDDSQNLITKAQILRLIPKTEIKLDSFTKTNYLKLFWIEEDKLKGDFYFSEENYNSKETNNSNIISKFFGNIVKVFHGEIKKDYFIDPSTEKLPEFEFGYYERTNKWGTICKLNYSPLAYKNVYGEKIPNGEIKPESTLDTTVHTGNDVSKWKEVISLVNSDENDQHFIIEIDELNQSYIRFGNGINGKKLPNKAQVHCSYQIGYGREGNIGAKKLVEIKDLSYDQIESVWNPLNVVNGRDQEPIEEILFKVPEAFKVRQLRAITVNPQVDDYEKRVEEVPEVSKSIASYKWMGSYRLVQLNVDPVGTFDLDDFNELYKKVLIYLDPVRLIGDKIVIKKPKYVPLEIRVSICVHSDYWPQDIRYILEDIFSSGYTSEGQKGFFHPDNWTFSQTLRDSQIIGKIQLIEGIDHVIDSSKNPLIIKRWGDDSIKSQKLELQSNEIILVKNDPNNVENGFIFFDLKGGRQ